MPKVEPTTPTISASRGGLLVFKYGSKRVMAKRQSCYKTAIQTCRSLFPSLPKDRTVTLSTKDLDICENELTVISEESWETAVPQLNCVIVTTEEKGNSTDVADNTRPASVPDAHDGKIKVTVLLSDGRSIDFRVSPTSKITRLLDAFSNRLGECAEDFRFLFGGESLWGESTFDYYGFQDGDTIDCVKIQRGGKPVIYLSSLTPVKASVKLSLTEQWDFSAIYPIVPIKPRTASSNEEISWNVTVNPNGDLTELTTGLNVAYLFWEAHTNPTVARPIALPPTPGAVPSLTENVDVFYPNSAELTEGNSVVLSIDKITPYLDKALSSLCLHTEARTSFITYWLPSLLKHKHVALRFVPQKSYEHAAPLVVSPAPDIITRIFMVFKGIEDEALDQWSAAVTRAHEDVQMWRDVVGVNGERAQDATLFRVLEWGGMEVLSRGSS